MAGMVHRRFDNWSARQSKPWLCDAKIHRLCCAHHASERARVPQSRCDWTNINCLCVLTFVPRNRVYIDNDTATDLETRAARVEPGKRKPVRIIGSGSLRRVASSDSSASESESESESDSDTDRARETKRQRVDAMAASSARGIEESDLRRDSCASPTILCGNGSLGAVQDDRRPGHSHSNAICTTTADVAALQTASNKAQQYRRENPHLHDNAALQSPNEPGPNSNTHPRSAALPRTLIEPMTPSTICLAALQSQCASMAAEITAMKLEHARDRESLTKRVTELEAHNERRRQQYA